MRTFPWLAMLLAVPLVGGVVTARQSAPAPNAATAPTGRPARPASAGARADSARPVLFGSIKELMQGIVDPSADFLWDAVAYDITAAGIAENVPKTKEDWAEVRRHALLLAEATNLLKMPGRRVEPAAPIPGMEQEPVGPEDLTAAQIQRLIDRNPAQFGRLAQQLAEGAILAVKAADARSVDDLFNAGAAIDQACETCHLKYWYPMGKTPEAPVSQRKK